MKKVLALSHLLKLFFCTSIIDYRFRTSTGQVFFDYSGNGFHGVNGNSHLNEVNDVIFSDRGVYFSKDYNMINSPPNSLISKNPVLYSPFSIIVWFNIAETSSNDVIVLRRHFTSNLNQRLTISRIPNTILNFYCTDTRICTPSGHTIFSTSKTIAGIWEILVFSINNTTLKYSITGGHQIIKSFPSTYSESSYNLSLHLGKVLSSSGKSMKMFMYRFLIVDSEVEISTLYSFSESFFECLTVPCSSPCPTSFKENSKNICLSLNIPVTQSANGLNCSCSYGCTNEITCLSPLSCSFNSTFINGSEKYCICGSSGNSTHCADAVCHPECLTCSFYYKCTSCRDSNALPGISVGCLCKDGYFNETALGKSESNCKACLPECKKCRNMNTCLECLDFNAFLNSSSLCQCKNGFYSIKDITNQRLICQKCLPECKTCFDSSSCKECNDQNSFLNSNMLCECKESFYDADDSSNLVCQKCLPECKACLNSSSCKECNDQNALLNSNHLCYCKDGFYDADDSSNLVCEKCLPECKTCLNSSSCSECSDNNSFVNSSLLCNCKEGFYDAEEGSKLVCEKCLPECKSCLDSSSCIECNVQNALLNSNMLCECKESFYDTDESLNLVCEKCLPQCKTCLNSISCIECNDQNLFLNSNLLCECKEGFYNPNAHSDQTLTCSACPIECKTCINSTHCLTCKDQNTELSSGKCICSNGFYQKEDTSEPSCLECSKTCLTCKGGSSFDCLSCIGTLLEGICYQSCPVGYRNISGACYQDSTDKLIVKFDFKRVSNNFIDSINNFSGLIKPLNYSETLGIFPSYRQGGYFEGNSFIEVAFENVTLLSNRFAFVVWILTKEDSGLIFIKKENWVNQTSENWDYLKLFLNDFAVQSEFSYNGNISVVDSRLLVKKDEWNQVVLFVNSSNILTISLNINNDESHFSFESVVFKDSSNSLIFIGGYSEDPSAYKGFMHSFEIYSKLVTSFSDFFTSTNCLDCENCKKSIFCLPTCSIHEFFNDSEISCKSCQSSCSKGCKNETSCSLCSDDHCNSCESFEDMSCLVCDEGFQVINKTCKKCETREYYNFHLKTCESCPNLCLSCQSYFFCNECYENAVISQGVCECKKGFRYEGICLRIIFEAQSWLSWDNVLRIKFSESLEHDLVDSELLVLVDGRKSQISIKRFDELSYDIRLKDYDFSEKSILNVTFTKNITSKNNSLLNRSSFINELHMTDEILEQKELVKMIKSNKRFASSGTTALFSIGLLISVLNFDPSLLFDFLNTAEMFYALCLCNIDISPILSEFLFSIRIQKSIPNIIKMISKHYNYSVPINSSKISKKFKKFGYSSHIFLINAGVQLTTIFVLILMTFILYLLKRLKPLKKICELILNVLIFGAFINIWLQTFFEVLIASTLSFWFFDKKDGFQIFDIVASVLFLVIFIKNLEFYFVFLLFSAIKTRSKTQDPEKILEMNQKLGVLFSEFKDEGVFSWFYYVFFIVRRILIVLCLNFVNDGALQLCFIVGVSIWVIKKQVPLYILYSKCFKSKIRLVYHFINESILAIFYITMIISVIFQKTNSKMVSNSGIYLVTASWGFNAFFNLILSCIKYYQKVRKCLGKSTAENLDFHVTKVVPITTENILISSVDQNFKKN